MVTLGNLTDTEVKILKFGTSGYTTEPMTQCRPTFDVGVLMCNTNFAVLVFTTT